MTTNDQGFTPGPWNFELSKEYGIVEGYDIWATNLSVALCDSKANARLIAAAPELLAAAFAALNALWNVPPVGKRYDQQHADTHMRSALRLQAAIAKATGE